jgi:ComF family protein
MLLDFFFPKKCFGCGKNDTYLCPECINKLNSFEQFCPVCGRVSVGGRTHKRCFSKDTSLEGLTSIWPYTGPLRKAIIALKYKFAYEIAGEIVGYATEILKKTKPLNRFKKVVLIPIPLFPSRENWRGFNQSIFMGKGIAKSLGWEFIPDLLVRKKFVRTQTGLKRKERLKNMQNSFSFNAKYISLKGKTYRLILFDDVFTTGATLKEAAKVLRQKGFKRVWGLTIAR